MATNIWFTSDTHGFHKNIVRGTTQWKDTPSNGQEVQQRVRDFDTVEEHNSALITGINSVVKENDLLYHLGDFVFDGIDRIWEFRKQINCKNIHLIFGNHDHHIERNSQIEVDPKRFQDLTGFAVDYTKRFQGKSFAYIQDIFESVNYYREISIEKQRIILCHYAFRVFNKSHHGAWSLYGHSHDSLDREGNIWGKSMDVGVDSAKRVLGEYRPFHIDEIREIMRKRDVLFVDHHYSTTN